MLTKTKKAMRLTGSGYDDEIQRLIDSGMEELKQAGINSDIPSPLIDAAVITYVRLHFGSPSDFANLQLTYEKQIHNLQLNSDFRLGCCL